MKIAGISVIAMILLSGFAQSQNLVRNPGFEALTRWDSLWILSFADPSSSGAVAVEHTRDVHEGSSSVELSNNKFNRWTYFYTDSLNAPLSFSANKSYVVSGWIKPLEQGKGASFTIFWNGSQDEKVIYAGNPDPITSPDWFMVRDTITPVADFDDGYLSLGMRAGKDGNAATGKILFDDLSVVMIPDNTEAEILGFSIPGQTRPAVINDSTHIITVEVPEGTDVTALAPDRIALSRGATVTPDTGAVMDFTSPVTYTVTAEDGITIQKWTVTVVFPPGSEADILAFSFPEQTGPAVIDTVSHEVHIEVKYGTSPKGLIPDIRVSEGAVVEPSGGVGLDFTSSVVYTVTAEDGANTQDWTVFVTVAAPGTETGITAFSFAGKDGTATIDKDSHKVFFTVPYGTPLDALMPVIEVSPGASIDPASGVKVDFSDPVVYTVTAEDGTTVQEWTVHVVVLPNTETDILSFSLNGQTGPATIDHERHTIAVEVARETDLTALVPALELSPGATVDPPDGVAVDFSNDVVYTVTAEDGITTQDWTVSVTVDPAVSVPASHSAPVFNVYPNPAHDLLIVNASVSGNIIIMDMLGRTVVSVYHATGKTKIPLNGFSQGTYFVTMAHPGSALISKVIIR